MFMMLSSGYATQGTTRSLGDRVAANFVKQVAMPLTRGKAIADGWDLVGPEDSCDPLYGYRYRKGSALGNTMLYSHRGEAVGMQWGYNSSVYPTYPCSNVGNKYFQETERGIQSVTVYFSDPQTLCSGGQKPPAGSVGDRLWVRTSASGSGDDAFLALPLHIDQVTSPASGGTDWVTQGCLPSGELAPQGMGQHYWYHSSKYQEDLLSALPFFLTFDQSGQLLMLGAATLATTPVWPTPDGGSEEGAAAPVELWEYPRQPMISSFFQNPSMPAQFLHINTADTTKPCGSYAGVSMHVAFRSADHVSAAACRVDLGDAVNKASKTMRVTSPEFLALVDAQYDTQKARDTCDSAARRCAVHKRIRGQK